MEAVIFDGKEYIKASVVAQKFGYTADYLGQLCRGKKIDARMVGRSWYINVDSLDAHRDSRYKVAIKEGSERTTSLGQLDAKKPRSHYLSRIDVEPILKKKTVSLYQERNGRLAPVPVKYEADDYSLIPRVNREAVSKSITIEPAEAEDLAVKQVEKHSHTLFKAEELPEVYLRGKLSVKGLEEVAVPEHETIPTVVSVPKIEPEIKTGRIESGDKLSAVTEKPHMVKVKLLKRRQEFSSAVSVPSAKAPGIKISKEERMSEVTISPAVESSQKLTPRVLTPKKPNEPADLVPRQQPLSFKPESVKSKERATIVRQPQKTGWFLPVFLILTAVVTAILLLTVSIQISVSVNKYQLRPQIDFSRLQDVISISAGLLR